MDEERRSEGRQRIEMRQAATLINSEGRSFPIFVKDLSRAGFRFEHRSEDLRLGEIVTIRSHRGIQARGEIKWTTTVEAGGVFIELPAAP